MTLYMYWIVAGLIAMVASGYVLARRGAHRSCVFLLGAGAETFYLVGSLVTGQDLISVMINAFFAVAWWIVWLKTRPPRRKRAKRQVGAKTKALVAKMVASMPKSSQQLRPNLNPG